MKFGGMLRTSTLDYPHKVCSIVFTKGCNFRCPFCHNPELVLGESNSNEIDEDEVIEMLLKRKYLVDALAISGGEPTLHKDLVKFVKKVKENGFLVKLDTNGTNPEMLKELLPLLDYIAMDVKANETKYSQACGVDGFLDKIKKSISLIREFAKDYEFRITILPDLLSFEDAKELAKELKGSKKMVLQQFQREETLNPSFKEKRIYDPDEFQVLKQIFEKQIENVEIRGL